MHTKVPTEGASKLNIFFYSSTVLMFLCICLNNFLCESAHLILTITLFFFSISLGVFTLVTVTLLLPIEKTKSAAETMDDVFMVFFPPYCLGKSFINIYVRYNLRNICLNPKPTNIIQVLSSGGNWLIVYSLNSIDIRVP